MPDGSTHRIKRGRPTLREGSVPSIFPNLPSYLSSSRKRRKPPCVRTELLTDSTEIKKKKGNLSVEPESFKVLEEGLIADKEGSIADNISDQIENETAALLRN